MRQRPVKTDRRPPSLDWSVKSPISRGLTLCAVVKGEEVVRRFTQEVAPEKQRAKDLAARSAYQWLQAQYPSVDLVNV